MKHRLAHYAPVLLTALATVLASLLISPHAASATSPNTGSTLTAGQELRLITSASGRQSIMSPDRSYQLSIYYNATSSRAGGVGIEIDEATPPVWAGIWTQTGAATPSTYLALQTDGNLVLYARAGDAIWSTRTAGTGSRNRLVMQDDGNLVLYNASGKAVWSSHTGKEVLGTGEKLTAGHRLINVYSHSVPPTVLSMQTDGDLVMTYHGAMVWASNTSAPGSYLVMQPNGSLAIIGKGAVQWTSRTIGMAGADGARPFLDVRTDGHFIVQVTPPTSIAASIRTIFDTSTGPGEFGRATPTDPLRLMTQRSVLHPGQSLIGAHGYRLTMQTDGNLVQRGRAGTVRWQSRTAGHPGAYTTLTWGGNLVVAYTSRVIWSTHTASTINFAMQADGNEVARDATGHVTWSSHTSA